MELGKAGVMVSYMYIKRFLLSPIKPPTILGIPWRGVMKQIRSFITADFVEKTQVTPAETLDVLQREKISGEPEVRIELQQLERQQRRGERFFSKKGGLETHKCQVMIVQVVSMIVSESVCKQKLLHKPILKEFN